MTKIWPNSLKNANSGRWEQCIAINFAKGFIFAISATKSCFSPNSKKSQNLTFFAKKPIDQKADFML